MTKLVIFDKDGTLTTTKSGEKFVQHPEDQVLLPGVAEGIAAMAADEWVMAIASNQGGVAAGHKTLDDAIQEMWYCLNLLPREGLTTPIRHMMFCPNDGESAIHLSHIDRAREMTNKRRDFRKPGNGMIDFIASAVCQHRPWKYDINVVFIGDRPEDEQAAAAAGVRFQWADEWRAQYI